jgi:hypothetical protein
MYKCDSCKYLRDDVTVRLSIAFVRCAFFDNLRKPITYAGLIAGSLPSDNYIPRDKIIEGKTDNCPAWEPSVR